MPDEFEDYVDHPRFGKHPQYTDLNPNAGAGALGIYFCRRTEEMIQGTAVVADWRKQRGTHVFRTHYIDLKRICIECGKPFIFYALEQRYWYEELCFAVDADCVRCPICRKNGAPVAKDRRRYHELFHLKEKTATETLEMAECCLRLIEIGEFSVKQIPHVRELLNVVIKMDANHSGASELRTRVENFTARNQVPSNEPHA